MSKGKIMSNNNSLDCQERGLTDVVLKLEKGVEKISTILGKIAGDAAILENGACDESTAAQLNPLMAAVTDDIREIKQMSAEFDTCLSEHLALLQRLISGDLSARIQGGSELGQLKSLNKFANEMLNGVQREMAVRKRSENELRKSEIRFRTFAEKSPTGISITRPDNTFEYFNPTFTELFGYTLTDIPDVATWHKKAHPDKTYRSYIQKHWGKKLKTTGPIKELTPETLAVTCKNGEEKIITFSPVRLPDGKIFMTHVDITERARAEEAVRDSEEKYQMLVDNIQDGVFFHQDGVVNFVNGAMAEMLGYRPEEAVGMQVRDFIAPEDRSYVESQIEKGFGRREYDIQLMHKDTTTRVPARINVSVFQYQNKPTFIGTIKDITRQLQTEAEKKKLEAQLRRSRQMEAIGTLAGGVAHDLNNILSGIVSYPELLLMDIPPDNPMRKPLLTIKTSGEKASAIVQDLLTLARRAVSNMVAVNLNDVVASTLNSPEIEMLNSFHPLVRIETNLGPDLMNINGSSVHLSKTILNLITNAAEAMPDGGTIRIKTENCRIDRTIRGFDAVKTGEYARLVVEDTGIGISVKDLDRIFEPFYTKKEMGRSGTGLGMAVVWGTVKDHGGYIDLVSEEGRGTRFMLYFPVSQKKTAPREKVDITAFQGRGEAVLVVDDVAEQREIATAILTKLGYRVFEAASGEDAVKLVEHQPVDLLLLDMIMAPGIDGLETYRRILNIHPKQKAIVASGFSLSTGIKEIQRMGAGTYLKKPYSLDKIARAVRQELEKNQPEA
jgi:PAS domain S-box-containing protein